MENSLNIRAARIDEYERVKDFYYDVIRHFKESEYDPKWEIGIYPADAYIYTAIEKQELYVGFIGEGMVAAMVLNHSFNEGYRHVQWLTDAKEEEAQVIHILCVHPKERKRNIAKQMVLWAIEYSKSHFQKSVRLDVLKGNVPAENLYPSLGFHFVTEERTYYDDLDWMDFVLFEYVLE